MTWLFWIGFLVLVVLLLAFDLGVLNRTPHVISVREALGWTALWIGVALVFNVFVYLVYEGHWLGMGQAIGQSGGQSGTSALDGREAALQFFTGYVVEKSLSLDNIFVMALVFSYFKVPPLYQHRVLFWGILGALILRGVMIGAGLAVIALFSWVNYVFGGILLLTAAKMLWSKEEDIEPDKNPFARLVRRFYPVTAAFHAERFFVRENGRRAATPLVLALVVIESSDVLFAVDSIPAVFAVTRDPFIVFTSNIFAILGLRSLYFALAALLHRFRYMKVSLMLLLAFVGVKLIASHHYEIPSLVSLAIIAGILALGTLASIWWPKEAAP